MVSSVKLDCRLEFSLNDKL